MQLIEIALILTMVANLTIVGVEDIEYEYDDAYYCNSTAHIVMCEEMIADDTYCYNSDEGEYDCLEQWKQIYEGNITIETMDEPGNYTFYNTSHKEKEVNITEIFNDTVLNFTAAEQPNNTEENIIEPIIENLNISTSPYCQVNLDCVVGDGVCYAIEGGVDIGEEILG